MYLFGREQWPLCASGTYLAKQFFAPNFELPFADCPSHQLGDNRTLILVPEGLIKGFLNLIRDTEIDGCHEMPLLLKTSTTANIPLIKIAFLGIAHGSVQYYVALCREIRALSAGISQKYWTTSWRISLPFQLHS
jgi:hypothetical protein